MGKRILYDTYLLLKTNFIFEYSTQIPPVPSRPDFDSSRAKLQKLSDSEGSLTREEYDKMKQELEA